MFKGVTWYCIAEVTTHYLTVSLHLITWTIVDTSLQPAVCVGVCMNEMQAVVSNCMQIIFFFMDNGIPNYC